MHTDVAALAAQAAGRAQHAPAWLLGLKAKAARAPLADGSLGVLRRGGVLVLFLVWLRPRVVA